jgi:uncharacterized protein YbaP (TraB family)
MLKTMMMRALAAFGLVALASCTTVPQQTAATGPRPAMWQIADDDTTVYLFGTIHLLPPNSSWRTPDFDAAVQQSQSLVVETLVDTANPQALASEMAALGFSSGLPPIAERVPPEKRALLEATIAKTQIPRPLFDRMETWAAAFTLLGVQFQTLGLQGDQGVEAVLRQIFTAAGKPVDQLETNREQLSLFDRLPENAQRQLLEGAIEAPEQTRVKFDQMLQAWLSGDVDAIARTFNEDLRNSPELKAALLTRRNANWAAWIERRLQTPGTVMVAVGAGHLAGDVSVQRYLESRGIRVRRVQ